MPRTLLTLIATSALVLPLAAGVYALSDRGQQGEDVATSLDQAMVDQAVEAEAPPLALTPEPSTAFPALSALAADDRAGAVALVRQALLDDPTILEDAIAALDVARTRQEDALVAQVIEDNAQTLFSAERASVMGNPDGAITLVEFLDYNCGFCKRSHSDVMRLIAEQNDVRVIVRDFPVLGPGSLEAAQIAVAYRAIGGDMAAFIHAMMSEEHAPADARLARAVALGLGASPVALDLALDNPELMAPIAEAYALAEQLNIRGTPAFVVGRERLMGAVGFDRISQAIQAERERLEAL